MINVAVFAIAMASAVMFIATAITAPAACDQGVNNTHATEDTQIESSFLAFQETWIQKLNKEGRYGEKSMRVGRSAEDRLLFVARYDVVKEAGACRIKKTGQTAYPYVGVMRYEVWSCAAKGKTRDEAKRGPFDCQPQSEITEIFRYTGGMWVD